MNNIQVIDAALNCTFSVCPATEEEFSVLFPEPGQDLQYAEDLVGLPNHAKTTPPSPPWERPVRIRDAHGIHGTLLYGLEQYKQRYAEKREDAVDPAALNAAQRRLFGGH